MSSDNFTFILAPVEILSADLTATELKVLLGLYSYRNKATNTVWPSTKALAERVGIADHTRISKITTSLKNKGWLTKKKRGFDGPNQYELSVPEPELSAVEPAKLDESTNLEKSTKTKLDESTNSKLDEFAKVKNTNEQTNEELNNSFGQFWTLWPKKSAKADAEKAWKKLKPNAALVNRILQDVARRIPSEGWRDPKFIPNPATYINGKRWEDEIPSATVHPFQPKPTAMRRSFGEVNYREGVPDDGSF